MIAFIQTSALMLGRIEKNTSVNQHLIVLQITRKTKLEMQARLISEGVFQECHELRFQVFEPFLRWIQWISLV